MGLKRLSATIGHQFTDESLLRQALTHPSLQPRPGRQKVQAHYERLEFLGDRVLGLVIADMLFHRFPEDDEGALTRRLTALVCRDALARVAETLGLAEHLTAASSESEGRGAAARLANACEAVIGAIYVDGGLDPAAAFVRSRWQAMVEEVVTPPKDPKMALQEWAQARGLPLPRYETVAQSGPSHAPSFEVRVSVLGCDPVIGSGSSKRLAERAAAETLLEKVNS